MLRPDRSDWPNGRIEFLYLSLCSRFVKTRVTRHSADDARTLTLLQMMTNSNLLSKSRTQHISDHLVFKHAIDHLLISASWSSTHETALSALWQVLVIRTSRHHLPSHNQQALSARRHKT